MARVVQPVVAPGARGVVTDFAPSQLNPDTLVRARDCAFIDGVLSQCGGWEWIGVQNAIGTRTVPIACGRYTFDGGASEKLLIVDANGRMADANAAGQEIVGPNGADWNWHRQNVQYRNREFVQNEVLLAGVGGENPLLRWAGATSNTLVHPQAGTASWTHDTSEITGSGTSWSTADIGKFVTPTVGVGASGTGRVESVESATKLTVSNTLVDESWTTASYSLHDTGVLGLMTVVCDYGTMSTAGSTVTGSGTQWTTTPNARRHGQPRVGDYFAPMDGSRTANGDVQRITAIGSDTSLTLDSAPTSGVSAAGSAYRILRPLCGSEARLHRGRVYATGVPWAPFRIWYTRPVGTVDVGEYGNDLDSLDTQAGLALEASYFDVSDRSGGDVVALTSTSEGLLIHRTNSLWIATGDPDFGFTTYEIGNIGTIDQRSVVEFEGVVYWVSHDGVYSYSGGSIKNLVAGRRMDEWHRIGVKGAVLGATRDHLTIAYKSGAHDPVTEPPWVYDLAREVWVGDWYWNRPGLDFMFSEIIPGRENQLLFVGGGTGGLGAYEDSSRYQVGDASDRFISTGCSTHKGAFLVWLPPAITGRKGMDVKRLLDVKTYYALNHDEGKTVPTFKVTTLSADTPGRELPSGTQQSASYGPADTGLGLDFPLDFPLDFTTVSTPYLNVTYTGTIRTGFVGTLTGPAIDPYIENSTTGERIDFTGTLTGAQQLIVDTVNRTATLAGVDSEPVVTIDWPDLIPGANTIRVGGSGMNAGVTLYEQTWFPLYGG